MDNTVKSLNEEILQWLEEMRQTALKRDNRFHFTLEKAMRSIKVHPVPIFYGKEAEVLPGIGPKIGSILETKLAVLYGANRPALMASSAQAKSAPAPPAAPKARKHPVVAADAENGARANALTALKSRKRKAQTDVDAHDNDNDGNGTLPAPAPPTKKAKRSFVPMHRSGSYAILLTLLAQEDQKKAFLSKQELIFLAQPLCESSFVFPEPGNRYTAWSNMASLLSRELVLKTKTRPEEFSLTDDGRELAEKLRAAAFGASAGDQGNPAAGALPSSSNNRSRSMTHAPTFAVSTPLPERGRGPTAVMPLKSAAAALLAVVCENCEVCQAAHKCLECDEAFCDDCYQATHKSQKKRAHARLPATATLHSYAPAAAPAPSRHSGPGVLDTGALAATPSLLLATPLPRHMRVKPDLVAGDDAVLDADVDAAATASNSVFSPMAGRHLSELALEDWGVPLAARLGLSPSLSRFRGTAGTGVVVSGVAGYSGVTAQPPRVFAPRSAPTTSLFSTSNAAAHTSSFILLPGQYDVVLVVDTREKGRRNDKGAIQQKLLSMGVEAIVKPLPLGDFLWIARERRVPVPGQLSLPPARELVFDYVVERKRMDDLASSILDQRFSEQKCRFKAAQIKHPIYVVEDHGSIDSHRIDGERLQQAMVNTQVEDGFFVKHTADLQASIAYLVLMTRFISGMVAQTAVVAEGIGSDTLSRKHPQRLLLRTYEEFAAVSSKTQSLTIKEMFIKHLVQMQQMTPQKAFAIAELYPTMGALMSAYDRAVSAKAGDDLLANAVVPGGRTIGDLLSAKVHHLYNDMQLH